MRKILGTIVGAGSAMALVMGLALVRWYVWDVVIGQSGVADRSMLFWGLPLVFLGVAAIGVSVGLAVVAKRSFTRRAPSAEAQRGSSGNQSSSL